jgi:putative Mg2+ transporter-C (MgtC) family protein
MFQNLLSIEPFHWSSVCTSIFCGTIVGVERQLRGKPVGIRTSSLIVLGTYIFLSVSMVVDTAATDPTRIIGQIVTGIGFLGAGVMLTKDGVILGVTSAATIWVLAAIGVTIPVAGNAAAIKLAVIVLAILYLVEELENYSSLFTRGVHARYNTWRTRSQKHNDNLDP